MPVDATTDVSAAAFTIPTEVPEADGTFIAMVRSIHNVGRSGIGEQAISTIDIAADGFSCRTQSRN